MYQQIDGVAMGSSSGPAFANSVYLLDNTRKNGFGKLAKPYCIFPMLMTSLPPSAWNPTVGAFLRLKTLHILV